MNLHRAIIYYEYYQNEIFEVLVFVIFTLPLVFTIHSLSMLAAQVLILFNCNLSCKFYLKQIFFYIYYLVSVNSIVIQCPLLVSLTWPARRLNTEIIIIIIFIIIIIVIIIKTAVNKTFLIYSSTCFQSCDLRQRFLQKKGPGFQPYPTGTQIFVVRLSAKFQVFT